METKQHQSEPQKHRIMVIDTGELEQQHYFSELAKHYSISFINSTDQAWELLNRAPLPDAIVLDVSISEADSAGLQFCHRIKEAPSFNDIPRVFLSVLIDPVIKTQVFELGCADFLAKPFDNAELCARLNHHIHQYHKTKKLESLIYIDPLTHLPNAAKFNEVLRQEWSRCARYWHHLSLIFVQVNNTALIKQDYGLDEYYAVIASMADDLCSVGARPGDLFASLDDNTFALLLSDCSVQGAQLKVSQIQDKLDHPHFMANHPHSGKNIACTVAYTVAAPAGGSSCDELIKTTKDLLIQSDGDVFSTVLHTPSILGIDGMEQSVNL
jgi:diguanylate cyclase (GGDEF)-like protein